MECVLWFPQREVNQSPVHLSFPACSVFISTVVVHCPSHWILVHLPLHMGVCGPHPRSPCPPIYTHPKNSNCRQRQSASLYFVLHYAFLWLPFCVARSIDRFLMRSWRLGQTAPCLFFSIPAWILTITSYSAYCCLGSLGLTHSWKPDLTFPLPTSYSNSFFTFRVHQIYRSSVGRGQTHRFGRRKSGGELGRSIERVEVGWRITSRFHP